MASGEQSSGPCIRVEVTARGVPVPGARVTASRREGRKDLPIFFGQEPLTLGPDGRGQSWCAPGRYLLAAHAPGFAPAILEIVESERGPPARARFRLQPGLAVSGHVLGKESQKPIARAELTFTPAEGFSVEHADQVVDTTSVTSDSEGAFRAGDLAPGIYQLTIKAPGHSSEITSVQVPRPEHLTLELNGTARLEGQVVNTAGAPIPDAAIWTGPPIRVDEVPPSRTDAQGRFSVEVGEGTYVLGAAGAGQAGLYEGKVTVVRGGRSSGLLVRLRPAGSLSGRVFQHFSQEPVANASIEVRHVDSGWRHPALTDADGTFLVEHLLPGRYSLHLIRPGLPRLTRGDLLVEPGQRLSVEFSVQRGATLEGQLKDALGRPLEDAHVHAVSLDRFDIEQEPQWTSADTDEKGHYVLKSLLPGRYRIEARDAYGPPPLTREIILREAEAARADFSLPVARGEVRGVVQRPGGGAPRYPVIVTASLSEDMDAVMAFPDASGHFTLKLLPGTYRLEASYVDLADPLREHILTVKAGRVSQLRITLPETVKETRGVVLTSRGEPATGAFVIFESEELTLREDADARGHFLLMAPRKKAGLVGTLYAKWEGEQGERRGVRLGSTGTVVRLVKAAALRGQVVATRGPPVQGFEVQAQIGRPDSPPEYRSRRRPFAGDTFELVDLPAGPFQLQVRTSDGRSGKAEVRLEPGQTAQVQVSVGTLGRVTGRLVFSSGSPREGRVLLDPGTPQEREAYAPRDGRFEFLAIEPGPHVLDQGTRYKPLFTVPEAEAVDLGDLGYLFAVPRRDEQCPVVGPPCSTEGGAHGEGIK